MTTYFVLVGVAYSVSMPLWASVGLCITLSLLSFFCAVISHNAIHVPIFHARGLNQFFQIVLSLTYGHPVSMFVPGHNLSHHKYLQTPKDRMRTEKMRFRWNLLNQLFFNFAVGGAIFRDNAEWAKRMRVERPKWFRQFLFEMTAYVTFMGLLLALDWQKFLVFVVIPHQYAVWGIAGINFVQHDGCDAGHPFNHSRNFTGKLVNWFTFNNGFHGMHHMRAGLHWSLLPDAHAHELSPHMDPRLEQASLLAYCFRAYIFPGKRIRFDGTPLVLSPLLPDEPWISSALRGVGDGNKDDEYGAVV